MNEKILTTFLILSILIIFGFLIGSCQFEIRDIRLLNQKYLEIENKDCIQYLSLLNSKPVWRLNLLLSLAISFILLLITYCIFFVKNSKIGININLTLLIFLLYTIIIFSFLYYFNNFNNWHILCGGFGCNKFESWEKTRHL